MTRDHLLKEIATKIIKYENNLKIKYFHDIGSGSIEFNEIEKQIFEFAKDLKNKFNICSALYFMNIYQYDSKLFEGKKRKLRTYQFNGSVENKYFNIWTENLESLLDHVISIRGLIQDKLPVELFWLITTVKDCNDETKQQIEEIGIFCLIEDDIKVKTVADKTVEEYLKFTRQEIDNKYKDISPISNQLERQLNKYFNELNISDKENEIKKFINYLYWVRLASPGINTVIHIPLSTIPEDTPMGIVLGMNLESWSENILNFISYLRIGSILITKLSIELEIQAHRRKIFEHAIKSGLAAIMSRNMSHNIGSHVLARLVSHGIDGWTKGKGVDEIIDSICTDDDNIKSKKKRKSLVYWSKDVQNLLKYLQQRQDFLAMVSTEWPEWTDVAYLMQDIMRWFFYQKQILDNIAASEGLSSHNYEKENNKDNYEKENNKDIRFHVFLVPEKLWGWQACSVYDRFNQIKNNCVSVKDQEGELGCNSNNNNCPSCRRVLLYTDEKTGSGRLSDDIQVAVPGGVIGYHAFYVLLENIIRNAAKHSFEGSSETHLDVVIEILYDPEEKIGINIKGEKRPAYLFRIYNNVGNVRNGRILLWNKKAKGESKEGINDYLGTPLIDETGKLKKECWGMAEMKIAAGFLQGRDIEQIGAGGDKIYGPYGSDKNYNFLKLAETEEGSPYIIRAIESPLGTLGYEFYVRKPKMLGIVCKKGDH